jgi:atypical dual specificity phosphatase
LPRLFLSDLHIATNAEELSRLGITHVVSVIEHVPDIPECIPSSNRLHLSLADRTEVDILSHLDETTEFIRKALGENTENKVLVHCFQGISRSATVVCAYIIATEYKHASEAVEFVQARRGIVCPNLGFRTQLATYAERFSEQRQAMIPVSRFARLFGMKKIRKQGNGTTIVNEFNTIHVVKPS